MVDQNSFKVGYAIALPPCPQLECPHLLPSEVAEKVLGGTHRPINPHAQRLLTAEARAARALKAEEKKKPKPQPQPKKDAPKRQACSWKKEVDVGPSRTEYSAAKQTFMQRCFGPDLFFLR